MVVEWHWFLGIATAAVMIAVPVRQVNRGIFLQNRCRAAWQDVLSELERRYELVPGLVAAVRPAMRHERQLLLELSQARAQARAAQGPPEERGQRERVLVQALERVLDIADRAPALGDMQAFTQARDDLAAAAQRIHDAQRTYNRLVRDYARQTRRFPAVVFTPLYHWSTIAPFEAGAARIAGPAEASN